ncbi:hypothetical protein PoB_006618600 [Plakobranchus ocellatus]|uniref:Uncharacterized protein n=1 Tax=Plakobranchus ocellatus TaxID=259542 RepID=A0AAV4D6J3_9GAST|nr:hypothetical protein PoB_006618600 [Plakobranchus ocellatus]
MCLCHHRLTWIIFPGYFWRRFLNVLPHRTSKSPPLDFKPLGSSCINSLPATAGSSGCYETASLSATDAAGGDGDLRPFDPLGKDHISCWYQLTQLTGVPVPLCDLQLIFSYFSSSSSLSSSCSSDHFLYCSNFTSIFRYSTFVRRFSLELKFVSPCDDRNLYPFLEITCRVLQTSTCKIIVNFRASTVRDRAADQLTSHSSTITRDDQDHCDMLSVTGQTEETTILPAKS